MAEQELENTENVVENQEKAAEPEKSAKKKAAPKKKESAVIVSEAIEPEESIDDLLDKLIAEEVSKGTIIGSMSADRKDPVAVDADATKVAVYSSRNASWGGYGSIYKGYNILSQRRADAWLTRPHVRVATPAEIAQHLR